MSSNRWMCDWQCTSEPQATEGEYGMNHYVRTLIADFLDAGLDDYVTVGEVDQMASELFRSPDESRRLALAAIHALLLNDLAVAGSLAEIGSGGWDLKPWQAFERIRSECERRDWDFGVDEWIWLTITDKGEEAARLLRLEGPQVLDRFLG